jgi:hypothetical protein
MGGQITVKMDHKEIECDDVVWIYLAQDGDHLQALVDMVMNLQVLCKGTG